MKIISFIEEPDVIKQLLQHLGLWEVRNNGPLPPPRLKSLVAHLPGLRSEEGVREEG
jgi:hypothetical protein